MFTRFIWKPDTTVKNAGRRASFGAFWRRLGSMAGKVWKCRGRSTSCTACQSGSQQGCHIGSMSHEHDSSTPRMPPIAATRRISATAASMSP